MKNVFIDGSAGTTGLRIYERLGARADINLLTLPEETRKDSKARAEMLNACDIAFLCLPDDAAREAVSMIQNENVVVLDTSTAHRTLDGWTYGFPELSAAQYEAVKHAKRIAVPGCHASGFIALIYPLIQEKILSPEARLTCQSLSGYSGAGKKAIAVYDSPEKPDLWNAPRQYALAQAHKHLPEMMKITGIEKQPAFCPVIDDFYSGMEVTVPLFAEMLLPAKTADDVKAAYKKYYHTDIVSYSENADESGFLSAAALSGTDAMELAVFGNDDIILPVARYDNLGKGASGAAVECMNIVLGLAPETGLELK